MNRRPLDIANPNTASEKSRSGRAETPPPARPLLRVLSLGAGVQSSALLLMSARGVLPKLDHAVFADTQWEPAEVYAQLDYLRPIAEAAGIPVHVVTAGNLRQHVIDAAEGRTARCSKPPMFARNRDGEKGILQRDCSRDFKVRAIEKRVKALAGFTPGRALPKTCVVEQWLGISADEIQRMKAADKPWFRIWHPLVEEPWTEGVIPYAPLRNIPRLDQRHALGRGGVAVAARLGGEQRAAPALVPGAGLGGQPRRDTAAVGPLARDGRELRLAARLRRAGRDDACRRARRGRDRVPRRIDGVEVVSPDGVVRRLPARPRRSRQRPARAAPLRRCRRGVVRRDRLLKDGAAMEPADPLPRRAGGRGADRRTGVVVVRRFRRADGQWIEVVQSRRTGAMWRREMKEPEA